MDDCATTGDAGDDFASATPVVPPHGRYAGCLIDLASTSDTEDWYSVDLGLQDTVLVSAFDDDYEGRRGARATSRRALAQARPRPRTRTRV